jgi:LmbE family N-acetylglucosaminyl deacetylase
MRSLQFGGVVLAERHLMNQRNGQARSELGPVTGHASGQIARRTRQDGKASVRLLALCLVAGAAIVILLEGVRRHALYWYDVDQDYVYTFDQAHSHAHSVQIARAGFGMPAATPAWATGVLEVEIAASPTGWWFEPCVEVGAVESQQIQCFERGAEGTRYLVLSKRDVDDEGFVKLRGRHLRITSGESTLWLFSGERASQGKVLVLAPHPDDAEIAAFGLYSTMDAYVATITAGNYVDGHYAGLASSPADQDVLRGDVRTWDSLVVPLWGGIGPERTVNLGYVTHSLSRFHANLRVPAAAAPSPESPVGRYRQGAIELLRARTATPDWGSVVTDLATVIDVISPAIVVSPHPMLDAHPDHQYTTVALLDALSTLDDERVTLLLYTDHHPQSESWPFGPSEALVTLPPSFERTMPVREIVSFPLSQELQLRKLFALEAMHDLRAPPMRLTGGPATVLGDRLRQAAEVIRRDPFGDYSYFRRAVRPNELFFVYPPAERAALRSYLDEHFPP